MHICMINIHGHLKKEGSPIGGHPDSGGQIVYVLNLAYYLGQKGHKVDLFTRAFKDNKWKGFDVKVEKLASNSNVNVVRIPCGPAGFVSKEEMWPYLSEFTSGIEDYYEKNKKSFDVINTHYADSGACGVLLKARTGKPLIHCGHSMGAMKLQNAGVTQGNFLSVNKKYSFHTRLFAERTTLNWADNVIVSTEDERYQQYGLNLYDGAIDVEDPKFMIVPPGVNTEAFYPFKGKITPVDKKAEKTIESIMEDGIDPSRRSFPSIFMVGRLDPRRNILGLIEAYANNKQLQDISNLFISSGGLLDPTFIKNWEGMQTNYKTLLKDIRKIIVRSGLQGKIVLTDIFDYDGEYPGILRYAAKNKWVYINPALHDNRGIAVLEAMASGLPVVTTSTGCTAQLVNNGMYGVLVEPTDPRSIANGLLSILSDENEWDRLSKKGHDFVVKNYAWSVISEKIEKILKDAVAKKDKIKSSYALLPPRYLRKPSDKSEKDLIDDLRTFLFNVAEGKRQASKVSRDLADLIIDELTRRKKKPFVFAMLGETGAGKTTIANKLSRTLNNLGYESVFFKMEDYMVDLPKDMVDKRVKAGVRQSVGIGEIDISTLNAHIKALLDGETIVSPVVNVKANSRKMRTIKGKPLYVIIVEGVYCDKLRNVDMLVHFDIDFDQLREQRAKKEDAFLYPKEDSMRTFLEDITRTEHEYVTKTGLAEKASLRINSKYEILYRIHSDKDGVMV
ncbi:MAG: glycosyltransferase [Pseudomonadota bacterium]